MNIFFLSKDPVKAARVQCDQHVVKMILETAQMLSTVAHEYKYHNTPGIYKPTHANHPMTKWVNTHKNNYLWACEHGLALCDEYTKRYGKVHKSQKLIQILYDLCKSVFTFGGGECNSTFITPPPLCMPDEFKQDDFVKAYKEYYKAKLLSWKIPPRWRLDEPDGVAV
jgi:hypothetical protein